MTPVKSIYYQADKGRLFRSAKQDEQGKIEVCYINLTTLETSISIDHDTSHIEVLEPVTFDERNRRFEQMHPDSMPIGADKFRVAFKKAVEIIEKSILP